MERRKQKRVHLFAPATFGKQGDDRTKYGVVMDVSFNGIFLMTNMVLDLGDHVWVDFKVHGNGVKVIGKVVRKKIINNPALVKYGKGGLGIHIEMMHPNVLEYIYERLQHELKLENMKKDQ